MTSNTVIPQNKFDIEAVERAKTISFPALNQHIPQYLEWLQDGNWPVANPVTGLLLYAGPEIIPHIINILRGNDEPWFYFLVVGLITEYKTKQPNYFAALQPELDRIKNNPTETEIIECVHEMVVELLET